MPFKNRFNKNEYIAIYTIYLRIITDIHASTVLGILTERVLRLSFIVQIVSPRHSDDLI